MNRVYLNAAVVSCYHAFTNDEISKNFRENNRRFLNMSADSESVMNSVLKLCQLEGKNSNVILGKASLFFRME